jgi:hypothetical protein
LKLPPFCLRMLPPALLALACSLPAVAEIGQIKASQGQVSVERKGLAMPGEAGMRLEPADMLKNCADGAVGITMREDSLLCAGPNSRLSLERFDFDATTRQGRFDAPRGTLAVVSSRIARQSPQAMTLRTASAQLGVRGTEFVVSAGE